MRLPSWMSSLLNKKAEDSPINTVTSDIIDPDAIGEVEAKIRPFTISVLSKDSGAVVLAFWQNSLRKVYEKPESDLDLAAKKFAELSGKVSKIKEKLAGGSYPEAEEESKKLLQDLKLSTESKKIVNMSDIDVAGVGVFNGEKFAFKDSYLSFLLKPIDISSSKPKIFNGSQSTLSYATHSKNHIGSNDFVLQWFPKVLTPEGMVENVALVEKNAEKAIQYFIVPDCDQNRFTKICRQLTPTYEDIGYEIKNGTIGKKATVTILYFETPDQAAQYQKLVQPGAPKNPPAATPASPKPLEDAGKALAESKPVAGTPKTYSQLKMEQAGKSMTPAATLKTEAKKGKDTVEDGYNSGLDPAKNGKSDFRLSNWDGQSAPETPQSAEAIMEIRFIEDLGAYEMDLPNGTRTNLSRDIAKAYLLNEGYELSEANALLDKSQKNKVELRKKASLDSVSSLVVKAAIIDKLKSIYGSSAIELHSELSKNIASLTETDVEINLNDLKSNKVASKFGDSWTLEDDEILEVASLLKSSELRRKAFVSIVKNSYKLNEIEESDVNKLVDHLGLAQTSNLDNAWLMAAKTSKNLFEKAKSSK